MAGLGHTIRNLSRTRKAWKSTFSALEPSGIAKGDGRLQEVKDFGANPGNLRMLEYVPALAEAPALVVVLHGCKQTAGGYDRGAGWSHLADRHGFALLFPEQKRANNPSNCFTWFDRNDTQRGVGEAASIRQMVEHMAGEHGIDRRRIFVTGLSAGGAMTSVMLATYPEIFAAGAIVGGLPYGAAGNVAEAFEAMSTARSSPARRLGDLVRTASPHKGPWPRVSVWHGSSDATVIPVNANEIVKQWADVHGLAASRPAQSSDSRLSRSLWSDNTGQEVIELMIVSGMGHGVPLAGEQQQCHGEPGPFFLYVGVASTCYIARFFGLMDANSPARPRSRHDAAARADGSAPIDPRPEDILLPGESETQEADRFAVDPHSVITRALKAAGLIRS